jgi:hypothetical protein
VRLSTAVDNRFRRDRSRSCTATRTSDREVVAISPRGNVKSSRGSRALGRLAPSPARAADDPPALRRALVGWKHRLYTAADLAALVVGARRVQLRAGTLGADVRARFDASGGDLATAMSGFAAAIREAGGLGRRTSAGAKHILAAPDRGSAAKRMMLLLRWMARPADGVDVGGWDLPPSALVIPSTSPALSRTWG